MNVIDIFLLLIILLCIFSGYQKGFIRGAADLLLLAISAIFALWACRYVAAFFEEHIMSIGVWTLPVTFIICYLFAQAILSALLAKLLQSMSPATHTNAVNRALGVVPGAVNGMLYAAIAAALLLALPLTDGLSTKTRDSSLAIAMTPHVQWMEDKLAPVFGDAVHRSISSMTVEPGSQRSIELGFTVTDARPRPDLEAEMLRLVNEERRKEGLPELKADPEMREVARAHSRDMFAKGYFSHINKDGRSPAARAREAGVRFLAAGENLALAPTLKMAHTGLMNSPGHRANILRRSFGRVGIGVLEGGRHGLMVTQNFRN